MKVAIAGNPNCGKTTIFNLLTSGTQYTGNRPGVTVEKKEGYLKGYKGDIIITDLPGIYSLSPYSPEEVAASSYLLEGEADLIINVLDASNLRRGLYLTVSLIKCNTPVILALNMIDLVKSRGDEIDCKALLKKLHCDAVAISGISGEGINALISKILEKRGKEQSLKNELSTYSNDIESAIDTISFMLPPQFDKRRRFLAERLLENCSSDIKKEIPKKLLPYFEKAMEEGGLEKTINEYKQSASFRYKDSLSSIMIAQRYNKAESLYKATYKRSNKQTASFSECIDKVVTSKLLAFPIFFLIIFIVYYLSVTLVGKLFSEPVNDILINGVLTSSVEGFLSGLNASPWLIMLVTNGIIGSVGTILSFIPQLTMLFILLSLLEECGYMSRVAFIMDRLFKKFGLSGKSVIPFIVASGCSVTGIMASKTIECEKERRLTAMTVSFIPCSAKLPIIALISSRLLGNAWWVSPCAYIIGILSVIVSGCILKKSYLFKDSFSTFIMEMPDYHRPHASSIIKSTRIQITAFIKKAGTLIMMSGIVIWFLSNISVKNGGFVFCENINDSIIALIGRRIFPLFRPLGFPSWESAVASLMGLLAKEEIVGVFGIFYHGQIEEVFTALSGASFLIFNLLCAPCIAAMGAMKKELGRKYMLFALFWQTGFAYSVSLMVYQGGVALQTGQVGIFTYVALGVLIGILFLLFRQRGGLKEGKRRIIGG